MILLHASFSAGDLLLWAETSKATKGSPRGAAVKVLKESLAAIGTVKLPACEVVAWLPSSAAGPLPSTALLDDEPLAAEAEAIVPWAVNAIPASAQDMIPLLASFTGNRVIHPGLLVGEDLPFGPRLCGSRRVW